MLELFNQGAKMLGKLFKKPTPNDMLDALNSRTFDENKANSILEEVDINYKNQDGQNFLHLIIPKNKNESVIWLIKNNIDINSTDAHGETALMIACKYGYIKIIKSLLNAHADIEIINHKDLCAIDLVTMNNHFEAYLLVKAQVSDINRINKQNLTLLHRAIQGKSFDIIDDLFHDEDFEVSNNILFYKHTFKDKEILNCILSKFEDLNLKDKQDRNILFYVVESGFEAKEVFNSLIEKGLNFQAIDNNGNNILLHLIETIVRKEQSKESVSSEETNILKKEIENLLSLLPIILEKDVDTKLINNKNETIISYASKNLSKSILITLLDYEIDIDILNHQNQTALSQIITSGTSYLETIHLLLDYGASPNIKNDEGINVIEKLIDAHLIINNNKKVKASQRSEISAGVDYFALLASVLVNTDTNLTNLNSKGEPYFFEALRFGNIDLIKLLIKHGTDINQVDNQGINIIYKFMSENQSFNKSSEQKEYYANLRSIIMMGANVNAKDSFGGITLHKAILDCDISTIKTLLHSGADINAIDNRGRTMVHNSIWKKNIKVFRLIYSYNKNILNDPDKFGVLPINYAAFLGYTELVLEFIEIGAHVNNTHRKSKYIINFLKKFHKSLDLLEGEVRTKAQKSKIRTLVENMKKEFSY